MKASSKGVAFIAAHEGIVTKAYQCPAGVWTIGIGHTSAAGAPKVKKGMTITREEAIRIFEQDLKKYTARVLKRMGHSPQNVVDGSSSFDFNTGAINKASWVGKFLAGAVDLAEKSFKSWNRGGGKVLKGLVRRRAEEADIIFRGIYPAEVNEKASQSESRTEIASVQDALKKLGYYTGNVDGIFGQLTKGAVENFQRKHGLKVDAIVGPATRAVLQRELDKKFANKASTGGGVLSAGGGSAADMAGKAVDPTTNAIDPTAAADLNFWLIIAVGLAVAGVVWAGFWLWRNRGLLTGKRVAT